MYVRLAFAVAINVDPDILIVDEALSVGDEAFQRKCFSRINRIRENGATILFVSHSASTVVELCDRAVLLDGGELLVADSPKHVVSRYQKLLYSPADKVAAIREAIKLEAHNMAGTGADSIVVEATVAEVLSATKGDGDDESYLEPGLVPKSTFHYEPVGAAIRDPHIETESGRRVNVLQSGNEYIYTYRVHFSQAAVAIRCGMLIKSVTGLELAGCVTSWAGENLPFVAANDEITVRFRFRCSFASGSYFLNAGVQGRLGEEEVYLDRWIDAAMFKVIHEPGRLTTTIMDLDITPEINAEGVVAVIS
jgi:lipopolysaccharide transport system ATP-binding protein